ncbi:hypothetical protein CLAIMM_09959 [Cladophialophora immunda]|nr:hypothetical protein CLAIMM_09959 [Cladophialophora immunda]
MHLLSGFIHPACNSTDLSVSTGAGLRPAPDVQASLGVFASSYLVPKVPLSLSYAHTDWVFHQRRVLLPPNEFTMLYSTKIAVCCLRHVMKTLPVTRLGRTVCVAPNGLASTQTNRQLTCSSRICRCILRTNGVMFGYGCSLPCIICKATVPETDRDLGSLNSGLNRDLLDRGAREFILYQTFVVRTRIRVACDWLESENRPDLQRLLSKLSSLNKVAQGNKKEWGNGNV